ncbi:MAG: response regulator transcription factor [Phycisphaerales bacterium]|nr:response regulator transcription factor [Phycisphaerales bacterium]
MSTPKRILVVEDEADLADLVSYNLRRAGYDVEVARDGAAALRAGSDNPPDLVILDLMLPKVSGLDVARELRTNPKTAGVPVIMVTAKAADADQIAGFRFGADDYVTKPFSMTVLLARVEALLRRARGAGSAGGGGGETGDGGGNGADVLSIRDLRLDLGTHEVRVGGEPVKTTLTEFRLLAALVRGRNKVLSREDLMYTAMGPDVVVSSRTIDVHMAAIRKKLGVSGAMIRTVRGVGYLLDERATADRAEAADL